MGFTTTWIKRPGYLGHFFALFCGAMLPFSFAPYHLWPLQVLSIAALFLSLKELTPKQALWRGWWYGLGVYASGVSWVYVSIHVFTNTPAPLAFTMTLLFVASLAWFFALMAFSFQKWFSKHRFTVLSFAAIWLLFEWSRSWMLGGFPWLYLGDGHISTWLAGFAPVFGVYSIGFIIVLSAGLLLNWQWKTRLKSGVALLISPWLIGFGFSQISWTGVTENGEINVVAIQGNIPQDRKWLPSEIYPTLEKYRVASEAHREANLILWPETAITVLHHQVQEYLEYLDDEGKQHDTSIITGIPYQQGTKEDYPGAYHNSVIALGSASGLYHKQKLVPFGEFMPIPDSWHGLLSFFNIPMNDFRPGKTHQAQLQVSSQTLQYGIAPYICYDIVYPDHVASYAKDAGILITISNDAWFGHSIGPLQHFDIARMRALENGRYLLRSTNTGITALVDHKGQVVNQLPQFEYGVLEAKAQIMEGNTPFNIWGSWPMLVLSVLSLLLIRLHASQYWPTRHSQHPS
ncbi:apolipoprotein N-acyltransferase [Oceaniserpentilla sp. 4NH20-0058]|uniref:apolipoprotein N-acyltransferase n=1 Tax=Oceaniserpentilla sp. 4NH20-0058 TaxID=3127660 RepID=UPI003105B637